MSSAGCFDGQYRIFKLKSESAPLLYRHYSDKDLNKLHPRTLRNGDEGIIELLRIIPACAVSTGANLFANCTDDSIYMFNMTSLRTTPVAVFSGRQNSAFCIKSSTSPDDQFLFGGSSDCHEYIWKYEADLPNFVTSYSRDPLNLKLKSQHLNLDPGLEPLKGKQKNSGQRLLTYKPCGNKWDPWLLLPKNPWPPKSASFTVC